MDHELDLVDTECLLDSDIFAPQGAKPVKRVHTLDNCKRVGMVNATKEWSLALCRIYAGLDEEGGAGHAKRCWIPHICGFDIYSWLSYPSFLQVQLRSSGPTPVRYPSRLSDLGYVFTSVFHLFL